MPCGVFLCPKVGKRRAEGSPFSIPIDDDFPTRSQSLINVEFTLFHSIPDAMPILGLMPLDGLIPSWLIVAYFAGIAMLPVAVLATIAFRLFGRRRHFPTLSPLPAAQIPPDLMRQAQPWIGRLGYLSYQVIQSYAEGDADSGHVTWFLASAKDRSAAVFRGHQTPGARRAKFTLTFYTYLDDDRTIVTADRPTARNPPGHWILKQQHFPTLEGQLTEHRALVANHIGPANPTLPSAEWLTEHIAKEEQALIASLIGSGDFTACADRILRPTISRIPLLTLRRFGSLITQSQRASGRRSDIASAASGSTLPDEQDPSVGGEPIQLSPEEWAERDLQTYRKHTQRPPGLKHLFLRLSVLVATVAFFTLTFGRDSIPLTVGLLLGIIAVHEFGHWIMMKSFGYRDIGRFFVPFIGPTDRGRKLHASPVQQFIVILAGPVPGLLVGIGILTAGFFITDLPIWLLDLGGYAVVLNAFHLLPILPLDGGKIVDLLIFRDLPLLRPLFTLFSAALTFLASFPLKSKAIRVISVGMFIGLVWDLRMIKVVRGGRRLGWAGTIDDEDVALRKIFQGIRKEENDDFFRSTGWQAKIDVLLAELLRKRPSFITRFFGGWVYWALCGLPLLLVIGMFALSAIGGIGSLARYDTDSSEFLAAFPSEERSITSEQNNFLKSLISLSNVPDDFKGDLPTPEQRKQAAAAADPRLSALLDQADWNVLSIAHHCDEIGTNNLSLWLEIQNEKLKSAQKQNRIPTAIRRAEIMLHAVATMEPALTLADRELLWDAELRTLTVIENIVASSNLDPQILSRLEARITALTKPPIPEVDNLLLVGAWGKRQSEKIDTLLKETPDEPEEADSHEKPADPRFWRHVYPQVRQLSENAFSLTAGAPATVGIARHWKSSRIVGEIPETLEEPIMTGPGEAEFITKFCDNVLQISWRRLAAISAIRLELYRQKENKFPPTWKHNLPGGASLTLTDDHGPCLKLTDQRTEAQLTLPSWLGVESVPRESLNYRSPLHGATVD